MPERLKIRIAAIVRNKDEILLLRRASGLQFWEFPAGTMRFGEAPNQTAERELAEETGIKAKSKGLFAVGSCTYRFMRNPEGDQVHEVVIAYLFETNSKKVDFSVNPEHEHQDQKWVKISNLRSMPDMALTITCILDELEKKLR